MSGQCWSSCCALSDSKRDNHNKIDNANNACPLRVKSAWGCRTFMFEILKLIHWATQSAPKYFEHFALCVRAVFIFFFFFVILLAIDKTPYIDHRMALTHEPHKKLRSTSVGSRLFTYSLWQEITMLLSSGRRRRGGDGRLIAPGSGRPSSLPFPAMLCRLPYHTCDKISHFPYHTCNNINAPPIPYHTGDNSITWVIIVSHGW